MNTEAPHPARQPAAIGRSSDLPNFERPPVTEVILSIQFAVLDKMTSAYIGLLWSRFREQYPEVSERATINAVFETFGTPPQRPAIQFEQFLSPPMPRYWFEKSGVPDLLQLQQDRIVHNWRNHEGDLVYPRYETLRERFRIEVNDFVAFLEQENLGELRPNQCEVTYSNIISLPDREGVHDSLEDITPLWTGRLNQELEGLETELENTSAQLRFKLNEAGRPVGRIHVSFQPVFRLSDPLKQMIKLEITARGRPGKETPESAFDFLDFGRRAVVKMFAAVTTRELHSTWGRTDGGS